MGYGYPVFFAQFATLWNFYLTTWEEYYTGTLYLSFFSGPVEGIVMVCMLYCATGYYGPWFWHAAITDLVPVLAVISPLQSVKIVDLYLYGCTLALAFNIVTSAGNVVNACRAKGQDLGPVFTGVLPFVGFYGTLFVWVYLSPELLQTRLLLPFCLNVGASVALSVGRIITAHVAHQEFPVRNFLMAFPTIAMCVQGMGSQWGWDKMCTTTALVWLGFGASFAVYGMFIAEVITEITGYLDIYCLTIKRKEKTN